MNKFKLRSKILKIRKKNSNKKLEINLNKFFSFLKINKLKSKNIGGYFPSNFEIDDLKILEMMEKKKFHISLPVIKENNQMNFLQWSRNDPLKINKFGIPEPKKGRVIAAEHFDYVFVPLLSIDSNGYRVGYGKGYYDKYLNRLTRSDKKIEAIGIAFSFQQYEKLPTNEFDFKLDNIFTDKGFIR